MLARKKLILRVNCLTKSGFKNGEEFENIAADYPALTTDDLEAIKEAMDAD